MTNDKKLPTINLKGKDYVQVKDRILFFNETFPNGSIVTEELLEQATGRVRFKAIITPNCDKPSRVFVGRSAGFIEDEKAYEKLETIAVGRCLAFMGVGVLESVASADEIQNFHQATKKQPSKKERDAAKDWKEGDKLVTGISQKTQKPWFAIQRGQEKIWLSEAEYMLFTDTHNAKAAQPENPFTI